MDHATHREDKPICPRCNGWGTRADGQDVDCKKCKGRGYLITVTPSRTPRSRNVNVIPASALANVPVQPVTLPIVASTQNCPCCHQPAGELYQIVDEHDQPWKLANKPCCQRCGERFIAYHTNTKAPSATNTQSL